MSEETITVTKDEVKRLHILAKVQEGSLTMREAAAVVGVTVRQLRRLRRRVEFIRPICPKALECSLDR